MDTIGDGHLLEDEYAAAVADDDDKERRGDKYLDGTSRILGFLGLLPRPLSEKEVLDLRGLWRVSRKDGLGFVGSSTMAATIIIGTASTNLLSPLTFQHSIQDGN